MPDENKNFLVEPDLAGQTLAALLRRWLPGQTWSQVRKLVAAQRVKVNGELWLDDARRLKEGDAVEVLHRPVPRPALLDAIPIRYIDEHVIVVEKPSGIPTVRHPAEREWKGDRRLLVPTLDDLVLHQIGQSVYKGARGGRGRLRIVHRLDKETSGLVVFARSVEAERGLGSQFAHHTVTRRYLAVVSGQVETQTIRSHLLRDRGDGRRGSARLLPGKSPPTNSKEAITHIEVAESLPGHTMLWCKLETGRTHQIRIHLAELGRPVCGDKVYGSAEPSAGPRPPRLALHAAELGFVHPVTEEALHWEMPLPPDLRDFVERLRT